MEGTSQFHTNLGWQCDNSLTLSLCTLHYLPLFFGLGVGRWGTTYLTLPVTRIFAVLKFFLLQRAIRHNPSLYLLLSPCFLSHSKPGFVTIPSNAQPSLPCSRKSSYLLHHYLPKKKYHIAPWWDRNSKHIKKHVSRGLFDLQCRSLLWLCYSWCR